MKWDLINSYTSYTMINQSETIIKKNLKKSLLLIIGCFLFVWLGYFLFNNVESFSSTRRYNPTFFKIVALLCILFFGYIGIFRIIDLMKNKPALVINKAGLLNDSNASSGINILWIDINKFQLSQIKRTKFILIYVQNPEKYLKKVGKIKRFIMELNGKMTGTPFSITTNNLSISAEELLKILKENKKRYDA